MSPPGRGSPIRFPTTATLALEAQSVNVARANLKDAERCGPLDEAAQLRRPGPFEQVLAHEQVPAPEEDSPRRLRMGEPRVAVARDHLRHQAQSAVALRSRRI